MLVKVMQVRSSYLGILDHRPWKVVSVWIVLSTDLCWWRDTREGAFKARSHGLDDGFYGDARTNLHFYCRIIYCISFFFDRTQITSRTPQILEAIVACSHDFTHSIAQIGYWTLSFILSPRDLVTGSPLYMPFLAHFSNSKCNESRVPCLSLPSF